MKGGILGSKPGEDPVEAISKERLSITQTNDIRWSNRKVMRGWGLPILLVTMVFLGVFYFPAELITITILVSVLLAIISKLGIDTNDNWRKVPEPDLSYVACSDSVECKGFANVNAIGLDLRWIPERLPHSLAQLLRALPMNHGFCLSAAMTPANPSNLLQHDVLTQPIEDYMRTKSSEEIDDYFRFRNGLWETRVTHIGLLPDASERRYHFSAVKGALPSKEWHIIKPKTLEGDLIQKNTIRQNGLFYMTGDELTSWLVQLRSELSQEVGTNIPGQFLIDIRPRECDYPLGAVLNPDTLRTGPTIGLSHEELADGFLLCGGSHTHRRNILAILIRGLLSNDKRVLLISNRTECLPLTALSDSAIALKLGKDFILNPIDPEGAPRTEYVSQLLSALEVFTESNLATAVYLETALNRAVALGDATIADVKIDVDEILTTEIESTDSQKLDPDKSSQKGIDAIARLHEGPGANFFYGTQTVRLKDLTRLTLGVILTSTGTSSMDMFAQDLLSMKLAGLNDDKNLVVILDGIENLRVTTSRYSKREPWVDRITTRIADKFSLILSLEHPSHLGSSVKNLFSSCLSLRMRNEKDIASINSLLGLNVISHGLHSKARWSPRETSYLRTMEDGHALLVRNSVETCQPVLLTEVGSLELPSTRQMQERKEKLLESGRDDSHFEKSVIDRIAKTDDAPLVKNILRLLERYEPLTEEAMRKFIQSSGKDGDIEGVLLRLRELGFIVQGHENHAGVSYRNYRLTMKGTLTLRRLEKEKGEL